MPRPSNTAQRREQIIDGLISAMAEHGYDGASTARIAKAAGLSSGLVHYHFETKQQILIAAIEKLSEQHHAALDAALSESLPGPMARIERFIDAHVGLHADPNPDALAVWVMLSGEAIRHEEVRLPFAQSIERTTKRFRALVDDAWPTGPNAGDASREDGIDRAVAAVIAAIQGYYVLACTARTLVPRGSAAPSVRSLAHALIPSTQTDEAHR